MFGCVSTEWQPSATTPGAFRRNVAGDADRPGPFRFELKVPAGARAEAHSHSVEVRVKVLRGSMFIIIGEPLDRQRAKNYLTGSSFVIPANTRHIEWWDRDSLMEAEGVGPMITTRGVEVATCYV